MKYAFFFCLLLLLPISCFAYVIEGDSVIQEDAYSQIKVTPATDFNPTKKFTQIFELTNKTDTEKWVYGGFKFDNPLQYAKVEYWNTPDYNWTDYNQACNNNFYYILNRYPNQKNPHWLRCYFVSDMNTPADPSDDQNITLWDANFYKGYLPEKIITIKKFLLVSGNKWDDVTALFSHTTFLNDELYYLAQPVFFQAHQTIKFRATYIPNIQDDTNKWEMVYYLGENAGCILNNSCIYSSWLDPWWNASWKRKYPITICPNTDLNKGQLIWLKDVNFVDMQAKTNLEDVRVIDENTNTELNRKTGGTNATTDGNIFYAIDNPLPKGSCNSDTYFVYSENAAATMPENTASNLENFENYATGTSTPFNAWYLRSGANQATTSTDYAKSATRSLKITSNSNYINMKWYDLIPNFDANLGNITEDINFWIYLTANNATTYHWVWYKSGASYDTMFGTYFNATGTITNAQDSHLLGNYEPNQWYKIQEIYTWNSSTHDVCIFQGTDTNLVACDTSQTNYGAGIATGFEIAPIQEGFYAYTDDITFFVPYQTNVSLGTAELSDSTAPKMTNDANNFWQNQDANVKINCNDSTTGNSDINSISIKKDLEAWQFFSAPGGIKSFDYNALFFTDTNHTLKYFCSDISGNTTDTNTIYVLIDKTNPLTNSNLTNNACYLDDKNIVLGCSDALSGCSLTQYNLDSGGWLTFDQNIYLNPSGLIAYVLDFNSKDNAGNIEATISISFTIDGLPLNVCPSVPASKQERYFEEKDYRQFKTDSPVFVSQEDTFLNKDKNQYLAPDDFRNKDLSAISGSVSPFAIDLWQTITIICFSVIIIIGIAIYGLKKTGYL